MRVSRLLLWPVLGLLPAGGVLAQSGEAVVGVAGGMVRNEQVWKPEASTTAVDGLLVALFVDAPTGWSVLRVLAEGAYTERGGDVRDDAGSPTPGRVRTRALTVSVLGQLGAALGPVHVRVMAGPSIDQVLSSRLDAQLGQILEEEGAVIFGVAVGAAIGGRLRGGVQVDADVRLWEGLGDAFSGGFRSFHNRSFEGRIRVGVPLSRLRAG